MSNLEYKAPTNADRVAYASAALEHYQGVKGEVVTDEPDNVRDLICDLMHWCAAHDVDFEEQLSTASENYAWEREDLPNV